MKSVFNKKTGEFAFQTTEDFFDAITYAGDMFKDCLPVWVYQALKDSDIYVFSEDKWYLKGISYSIMKKDWIVKGRNGLRVVDDERISDYFEVA